MTGSVHIPKDLRGVARKARKAGWRIEVAGSGHLRWTAPDGRFVTMSATPRRGGLDNCLADLRRLGAPGTDRPTGAPAPRPARPVLTATATDRPQQPTQDRAIPARSVSSQENPVEPTQYGTVRSAVLAVMAPDKTYTVSDLAPHVDGFDSLQIKNTLVQAARQGEVERVARGVYRLAPVGRAAPARGAQHALLMAMPAGNLVDKTTTARITGLSEATAGGALNRLAAAGLIERVMAGVYRLPATHSNGHAPDPVEPEPEPTPEPTAAESAAIAEAETWLESPVESVDDTVEALLSLVAPDGIPAGHFGTASRFVEAARALIEAVR